MININHVKVDTEDKFELPMNVAFLTMSDNVAFMFHALLQKYFLHYHLITHGAVNDSIKHGKLWSSLMTLD